MKFKNRFLFLAMALLVMAAALVGCGSSDTESSAESITGSSTESLASSMIEFEDETDDMEASTDATEELSEEEVDDTEASTGSTEELIEEEADDMEASTDSTEELSEEETDTLDEQNMSESAVVGKVTSIEDSVIAITVYEPTEAGEIEDYAAVDISGYSVTLEEETYTLDGTESIYIADNGVMEEASAEDIAVGDMLISYMDENEMPAIVIYPAE